MIECALFCGVIGYEEELVIVMLLHPIKAEFLCLGGQIAAFAFRGNIAVFLFKSIVKLRKSDNGERKRGHNEFNAESFLYAFAVFFVDNAESICQYFGLNLHNIAIGFDIAEFKVKARKFGCVLACERFFRTENGTDLKYTFKTRRHCHLLVELRTLGKIRLAVKIFNFKNIRAALACRSDKLRSVNLDKVLFKEVFAHCVHKAALNLKQELVLVRAQIDPAIVQPLIDCRAFDRLFFLCCGNFLADNGQCVRNGFDFKFRRQKLDSAHFNVLVFRNKSGAADYGIGSYARNVVNKRGAFLFFDGYLQLSGDVLDDDKSH